ncbi:unnamed protein product [Paramecium primaurelia]|uniref:Uncharacterized protein n=1 Tax=Paramecium primaurelia TaxID=5886 RepID=A0A8S1JTE7_PARPR|nr:unnamed protein product [Paramecium primaurelia]CAD8043870.1 unnamed protein product [Paramecium primaurelia]
MKIKDFNIFQNIKHLRKKVLLSSAIQNGKSIQDFVSIDPATLIKIGLSQNSLELYNSLRDRLNFCKYEKITDQRNFMIYVYTSHINQFTDRQSYDHVIVNQFNENVINSHMIWLSYHLQQWNRRITCNLIKSSLNYKNSSLQKIHNQINFISLLQKLNHNDSDLSKYNKQVEYLKIYDLQDSY